MRVENLDNRFLTYLDSSYDNLKESSNGWYSFDCPSCGNKSGRGAAVNIENLHIKCWNCTLSFNSYTFILEYEPNVNSFSEYVNFLSEYGETTILLSYNGKKENKKIPFQWPESYVSLGKGSGFIYRRIKKYLEDRKLNFDRLVDKQFGYCTNDKYYGYLVIPFEKFGDVVYWQLRTVIQKDAQRYLFPPSGLFEHTKSDILYGLDNFYLYRKIFLFEGWSDAETIKNGSSLNGTSISDAQLYQINESPVVEVSIGLDKGKEAEALKIANKLTRTKEVRILEFKKGDPNEVGKKKIKKIYNKSEPFDIFNYALKSK